MAAGIGISKDEKLRFAEFEPYRNAFETECGSKPISNVTDIRSVDQLGVVGKDNKRRRSYLGLRDIFELNELAFAGGRFSRTEGCSQEFIQLGSTYLSVVLTIHILDKRQRSGHPLAGESGRIDDR